MKQKLFLIPVMFLLVLPFAFPLTDEEINSVSSSCVLKNFLDDDLLTDNATGNTASSSGGFIHNPSSTNCIVGGCGYYDGATNTVIVHDNIAAYNEGNYTAIVWLNETGSSGTAYAKNFDSNDGNAIYMEMAAGVFSGGIYSNYPNPSIADTHDGTWEMHIFKTNDTNVCVSINGSSDSCVAQTQSIRTNTRDLWIGAREAVPTQDVAGGYDEILWCDRFLTLAETRYIYDENIAGRHLLNISAPADSCTYSSGDWNIDASDNCVISTLVDVGGNSVSLTGSGTLTITSSGSIANSDLFAVHGSDALVTCRNTGGCYT